MENALHNGDEVWTVSAILDVEFNSTFKWTFNHLCKTFIFIDMTIILILNQFRSWSKGKPLNFNI